jgi:hypothetical protein
MLTPYLVKVLEEVDYAALDLILLQTGGGGVASRDLESDGSETSSWGNCDLTANGNRGPRNLARHTACRPDNGCSEHSE